MQGERFFLCSDNCLVLNAWVLLFSWGCCCTHVLRDFSSRDEGIDGFGAHQLAYLLSRSFCPSYSTSVPKLTLQANDNRKGKEEQKKWRSEWWNERGVWEGVWECAIIALGCQDFSFLPGLSLSRCLFSHKKGIIEIRVYVGASWVSLS